MEKTTLLRADEPTGGRRTTRLQDRPGPDRDNLVQLSGALIVPKPDEEGYLLQIKVWSHTPLGGRWTEFALDEYHNEVARAHFHEHEERAWKSLANTLRRKDYIS